MLKSHLPVLLSAKGADSYLSEGISENTLIISDNTTLNCKEVAPSHIKGGETAMGYPIELTQC